MKKSTILLTATLSIMLAGTAGGFAKSAKKPKGVFCEHFSESVFIPISRLITAAKPLNWRVGEVAFINIAGAGRVKCKVV